MAPSSNEDQHTPMSISETTIAQPPSPAEAVEIRILEMEINNV